MKGLYSTFLLLAAGLTLSACQTGRGEPPAITPDQAAVATPPPAQVAPTPAPTVAALPPVDDNPARLMGLGREDLSALLGTPDLIRREAPAEIWQYVGGDCVFDVVLYQRGADYAVSYLEARDTSAAVQPSRQCLNRLLRARQAAPVS